MRIYISIVNEFLIKKNKEKLQEKKKAKIRVKILIQIRNSLNQGIIVRN